WVAAAGPMRSIPAGDFVQSLAVGNAKCISISRHFLFLVRVKTRNDNGPRDLLFQRTAADSFPTGSGGPLSRRVFADVCSSRSPDNTISSVKLNNIAPRSSIFESALLTRFGDSDYHNHDKALTRIRQTGSVRDYQKEFDRLACRVRGWPESVLVGAFVGGLRYDLAAEVRLERPETMHKAMDVARRREEHLAATQRGRANFLVPEPRRVPVSVGAPSANAMPPGTFRPPATEVKRLTEEEMARRREKGLCFRCEEKYTPGHRCKQNFLIEFMDSDDEEPMIEEERVVEVEVLNDEAEISVHVMAGTKGLRTMKLPAWLKDRRVTVLVDNGSSHNFINATLSHKLKFPTTTIESFEVRVANDERLRCSKMYRGVPIKFQGVTMKADLFALPLVGPDVVLGVQWLEGLGDVMTNYRKGVMKFEAGDQLVTLKASEGATKE
ncbi:Unknown protein, partial [Striga hermonthica]